MLIGLSPTREITYFPPGALGNDESERILPLADYLLDEAGEERLHVAPATHPTTYRLLRVRANRFPSVIRVFRGRNEWWWLTGKIFSGQTEPLWECTQARHAIPRSGSESGSDVGVHMSVVRSILHT